MEISGLNDIKTNKTQESTNCLLNMIQRLFKMIASIFSSSTPMNERDVKKEDTSQAAKKATKVNTVVHKPTIESRIATAKSEASNYLTGLSKAEVEEYISKVEGNHTIYDNLLIKLEDDYVHKDSYVHNSLIDTYVTDLKRYQDELEVLKAQLDIAEEQLAKFATIAEEQLAKFAT